MDIQLSPLGSTIISRRHAVLEELRYDPAKKYLNLQMIDPEHNATWVRDAEARTSKYPGICYYAIFTGEKKGNYSGEIAIDFIDPQTGIANLLYWIKPAMRGKGIAVYAIERIKEGIFLTPSIRWLQFMIDQPNLASRRVALKAGAIPYSKLRTTILVNTRMSRFRNYYYLPVNGTVPIIS